MAERPISQIMRPAVPWSGKQISCLRERALKGTLSPEKIKAAGSLKISPHTDLREMQRLSIPQKEVAIVAAAESKPFFPSTRLSDDLFQLATNPMEAVRLRIAAVDALSLMPDQSIDRLASLQDLQGPNASYVHKRTIEVLAIRCGESGKMKINELFGDYLARLRDLNERDTKTNPYVLATFLNHIHDIDLLNEAWGILVQEGFKGSEPDPYFSLWSDAAKNAQGHVAFHALVQALGKQKEKPSWASATIGTLRRLRIMKESSYVHREAVVALGNLASEVGWFALNGDLPNFPFDATINARTDYIENLISLLKRPKESDPPSEGNLNTFVLSGIAEALGNYPRPESIKILEAAGLWSLRYSKQQTTVTGASAHGASYVEQGVVKALGKIIANASKPEATPVEKEACDAARKVLFQMINATIRLQRKGSGTPYNRLANEYVLSAYVDAIDLLVEMGSITSDVAIGALESFSAFYKTRDILKQTFKEIALLDPDRFLKMVGSRKTIATFDEKAAVAYALGTLVTELGRDETKTRILATRVVAFRLRQDARDILEEYINLNHPDVLSETITALQAFKDRRSELLLIALMLYREIGKEYGLKIKNKIINALVEIGGEDTLALFNNLLDFESEISAGLRNIPRVDIEKMTYEAISQFIRAREGWTDLPSDKENKLD